MIAEKEVGVLLSYGLSTNCKGIFERKSLDGASVMDVIQRVTHMPQSNSDADRTASVLQEVLDSNRTLDIEILHGSGNEMDEGKPVQMDSLLLNPADSGEEKEIPQDITLRVSEPYRGGTNPLSRGGLLWIVFIDLDCSNTSN